MSLSNYLLIYIPTTVDEVYVLGQIHIPVYAEVLTAHSESSWHVFYTV